MSETKQEVFDELLSEYESIEKDNAHNGRLEESEVDTSVKKYGERYSLAE